MAKKLSEFLEELKATNPDIKLEDLMYEDGTPLPAVFDAYKNAGATSAQAKDLEAKLNKAIELNQQWQKYGEEVERGKKTAQPAATKEQKDILAVFEDPAYSPLKPVFSQVVNTLQAFADNLVGLHNQYQQDRQYAASQFEDFTISKLQAKYGDKWDTEKVREYAKKNGINSWDGAFKAMIGENLPGEVEKAEKIAREKWEKESKEKKEAGRTEMGGGGGTPQGGGEKSSKPGGLESLGSKVVEAMKAQGFK